MQQAVRQTVKAVNVCSFTVQQPHRCHRKPSFQFLKHLPQKDYALKLHHCTTNFGVAGIFKPSVAIAKIRHSHQNVRSAGTTLAKTHMHGPSTLSTWKMNTDISYLSADTAQKIDKELFDDYKFSVDQLMELAGLSVAIAIANSYPLATSAPATNNKILVLVGPGNNGGDGLVAARHLRWFGYDPTIYYPKRTDKELYMNLITQCEKLNIKFLQNLPKADDNDNDPQQQFMLIVDALFGFSFKPPVREELEPAMQYLLSATKIPICSIDVPSGWPVDGGHQQNADDDSSFIKPECLVSLMLPKLCAKQFRGKFHWLGGRFLPSGIVEKYKLQPPEFANGEVITLLSGPKSSKK